MHANKVLLHLNCFLYNMSDEIKHECGLAFIRLRKPFSYYQQKYKSVLYGLNKLYLLMEKQHNRGQDGAGIATVKLNTEPGYPFLYRVRSNAQQLLQTFFPRSAKRSAMWKDTSRIFCNTRAS